MHIRDPALEVDMPNMTIRIRVQGGLGDILFLTPSLRALKQRDPQCRTIVFFENPTAKSLLKFNPYIDQAKLVGKAFGGGLLQRKKRRQLRVVSNNKAAPNLFYRHGATSFCQVKSQ